MSNFNFTVNPISSNDIKKISKVWEYFGPCLMNGMPVNDGLIYCKICVEEKKSQETK